jgi:hypothetical protein
MVTPRFPGTVATLSPFMLGTVATDQITGEQRSLNDLDRRRLDFTSLVCSSGTGAPTVDAGSSPVVDAGSSPLVDAGPSSHDAARRDR